MIQGEQRQVYTPKQMDIVWIDFDPSVGKEIQKRRPALVVSTDDFNRNLGFCIVCPISSTQRDFPTYIPIRNPQTITGEVVTHQIRSVDFSRRNLTKIEKCDVLTWIDVQQTIGQFFNQRGFA